MEKEGFSKQEKDGFWLVGISLFLLVVITNIDYFAQLVKSSEIYYAILGVIAFFWGAILVIIGRKKRLK